MNKAWPIIFLVAFWGCAESAEGSAVADCGNEKCEVGEDPTLCPQDCQGDCGNGTCSDGENPFNCPQDCPNAVCGNDECEVGESPDTCPQDCINPCGNKECEAGENPFNCPQDCQGAVCGNDQCDVGESPDSCPQDCGGTACGNGECEVGEDVASCPQDCDAAVCGNSKCEVGENPQDCPEDCKAACGNDECEPGENIDTCPQDCGASVCGNGTCEFGEDPYTCPNDCKAACGNSECEAGETIETCPQDCGAAVCGNGDCEFGEDPYTCPDDCKAACGNNECEPGENIDTCPQDCATACGDGKCQVGEAALCPVDCCTDCEDGLECTSGKCLEIGKACVQLVTPGFCLINNQCIEGGDPKTGSPCLTCQPVVDDDGWTPADGKTCDDNEPCTIADQCGNGVCQGLDKNCDDGNVCTIDFCDADGTCQHGAQPGDCDDNVACTKTDVCVVGTCQGIPFTCNDNLSCTVDQCKGEGECEHVQTAASCLIGGQCLEPGAVDVLNPCLVCAPLAANDGWSSNDGGDCNDGKPCTSADTCLNGACTGTPTVCPDDGDACTVAACTPGVGCESTTKNCDDGNKCSGETCDPQSGCTYPAVDGDCNDGLPCTESDSCVDGVCVGTPKTCDDDNLCTSDSCNEGICYNVDTSLECNDDTPCTNDFCVPSKGCQNLANTAPCDDGDLCTGTPNGQPDTCANGSCQPGDTLTCDDALPCTTDFCIPSKGCTYAPNDAACNDFVPCTLDQCKPGVGCTNIPVYSLCDDGLACTNDVCGSAGCEHKELCGVTVLGTSYGLDPAADVLTVFAYDSVPDTQGSGWKSGTGAGWAAEAQEQFSGRSIVLSGFSEPSNGDNSANNSTPSWIGLPLSGEAASTSAVTLELWFRISGLTPYYEGMSGGYDGEELVIFDGNGLKMGEQTYCYDAGPDPRLSWAVALGRWKDDGVCLETPEWSHACGLSNGWNFTDEYNFPKEEWIHLAIVRGDPSEGVHFYVDGALHGQAGASDPNFQSVSKLSLGLRSRMGQASKLNVSVDEIKLYGAALSQADIQAHRAADLAGETDTPWPNLLQRWSFDDPLPGALDTANGVRRSDRSSDPAFPDTAWLIGTPQGLDIVDAHTRSLWMRFEQNGLGRSILTTGVEDLTAAEGVVFATGSGAGTDYELVFDPNTGAGDQNYHTSAWRRRACPSESEELRCSFDSCFDGNQCGCKAKVFESIACRNREALPYQDNDCYEGKTTVVAPGACNNSFAIARASSDGGFQLSIGNSLASFDQYPAVRAMAWADSTLYVAAANADESCTRISLVEHKQCDLSKACGNNDVECMAGGRHLYAGSLKGTYVDPGTACGTPAAVVHDMVVTQGTSTVNSAFNTVYLAGDSRVAIIQEANHDAGGFDQADKTIWSTQGSNVGGFAILPAGPYTSLVPCGGYLYIGTTSNGIVVVDPDKPAKVVKVYSEPEMPANEIRDLACTENGAIATMHRVLAATPSGAAEIGAISK